MSVGDVTTTGALMGETWRELWKKACAGTKPSYKILVPDSVPDTVVDAWDARGYRFAGGSFSPFTPGMNRNLIKSGVLHRFTETTGVIATGGVGTPVAIHAAEAGHLAAGGAVGLGVVAATSLAAIGYTGRKFHRDPKRIRFKDRKAVRHAQWIMPAQLGYLPGRGGQDTDEQRLFHLAVTVARTIATTNAWTHPLLEDHVAKVDLDHAVGSIGAGLVDLYNLRSELDEIREPHLDRQIDSYQDKLAQAFGSLARRVVAMNAYLRQLQDLDVQLRMLNHSEAAGQLGERVLDVLARTAADDSADWRFRELGIETESHAEAIRGMLTNLDQTAVEFDDLDGLLADEERKQRGLR